MVNETEEQLPAKPVGLFSKVTSHRTEIAKERKYKISDGDGNINFVGEHQVDETGVINRININDSDGRSNITESRWKISRSTYSTFMGLQQSNLHNASAWQNSL